MFWPTYQRRRKVWAPNSIWEDLRRVRRDLDFLYGGTRGPIRRTFPTLNAWTNEQELIVTAELPGIEPDAIDITVTGETLTIAGSRVVEALPEGIQYHRRERHSGEFNRSIELPFQVDANNVEASYQDGILRITLPRLPEEMPKKISVSSA